MKKGGGINGANWSSSSSSSPLAREREWANKEPPSLQVGHGGGGRREREGGGRPLIGEGEEASKVNK